MKTFIILGIVFFMVCFNYYKGGLDAVKECEKEAVAHKAAHFVVDSKGDIKFKWNDEIQ